MISLNPDWLIKFGNTHSSSSEDAKGGSSVVNRQELTLAQKINIWVQTIGIIVAAGWGVYAFVYKEIAIPTSAPTNVTLNLQLRRIGTRGGKHPLVAVEMRVSATNPSSRTVHLLPSGWIVYGAKVTSPAYGKGESFETRANALVNSNEARFVQKHAAIHSHTVVAIGRLFRDNVLNPGEVASRIVVFHVPPHEYDFLEATAWMPSVAKEGGIQLEWTLKGSELVQTMYRISGSGERKPMKQGDLDEKLGLQLHRFSGDLSLW